MDDLIDFMNKKGALPENEIYDHVMGYESKDVINSMFLARVINSIVEMYNIPVEEAMDIFYNSETFNMIEEHVADLHCRSEKYLADETMLEYQGKLGKH
jgi:hypothetical protein